MVTILWLRPITEKEEITHPADNPVADNRARECLMVIFAFCGQNINWAKIEIKYYKSIVLCSQNSYPEHQIIIIINFTVSADY